MRERVDALAFTSRMVRSLRALEGALLDNSMRYLHAPCQVQVSGALDAETGWFRRQVSDAAPSVLASDPPHLFEPWFRSSSPVQDRTRQGSGLGLATATAKVKAKAIMTAHGGHIAAMPSAQGGLTFKIHPLLKAR